MPMRPVLEAEIGTIDLIPRATFSISVDEFAQMHNFEFESGEDDLDTYRVLYLIFHDDTRIGAFMHHAHEPANELTLYLERHLGAEVVSSTICDVIEQCGGWERLRPFWMNLSHGHVRAASTDTVIEPDG